MGAETEAWRVDVVEWFFKEWRLALPLWLGTFDTRPSYPSPCSQL